MCRPTRRRLSGAGRPIALELGRADAYLRVLELLPGETLHDRLSGELDVDPARIKLVCKGHNYSSVLPATATEQLVELCRGGAVVMVILKQNTRRYRPQGIAVVFGGVFSIHKDPKNVYCIFNIYHLKH